MQQHDASRVSVIVAVGLVVLFGSLSSSSVQAADKRWEVGIRAIMVTAGGEPTNDQMGAGIFGRYRLNEKWLVGVSVDELSGELTDRSNGTTATLDDYTTWGLNVGLRVTF